MIYVQQYQSVSHKMLLYIFILCCCLIDHTEHNIPADVGKRLARVSIRNQMTYDISLDDPIYIPPGEEEKELTEKKELLLGNWYTINYITMLF